MDLNPLLSDAGIDDNGNKNRFVKTRSISGLFRENDLTKLISYSL